MNPSREKNISARCELALGSKILVKKTLKTESNWWTHGPTERQTTLIQTSCETSGIKGKLPHISLVLSSSDGYVSKHMLSQVLRKRFKKQTHNVCWQRKREDLLSVTHCCDTGDMIRVRLSAWAIRQTASANHWRKQETTQEVKPDCTQASEDRLKMNRYGSKTHMWAEMKTC